MQINRNIAIGTMKGELIHLILEDDPGGRMRIMDEIVSEIKDNLLPVRKDRNYDRSCGKLASKYSNTKKRCF